MSQRWRSLKRGVLLALVGVVGSSPTVSAGDHVEAPGVVDDRAGDIADLYAWHTDDGNLIVVLTWAGYGLAAEPATYDPEVLYSIHIDTDGDNASDIAVRTRFGANTAGAWGLQVTNAPGAAGPIEGPVETVLESGPVKVWAGLRDDPFFFDKEGFVTTLMTGTVSFDPERDFARFLNCTTLVLALPLEAVGEEKFQIWATTGRI